MYVCCLRERERNLGSGEAHFSRLCLLTHRGQLAKKRPFLAWLAAHQAEQLLLQALTAADASVVIGAVDGSSSTSFSFSLVFHTAVCEPKTRWAEICFHFDDRPRSLVFVAFLARFFACSHPRSVSQAAGGEIGLSGERSLPPLRQKSGNSCLSASLAGKEGCCKLRFYN